MNIGSVGGNKSNNINKNHNIMEWNGNGAPSGPTDDMDQTNNLFAEISPLVASS